MIAYWEDKNTGNLVARCDAYAETICEALFNLQDCWVNRDLFDAQLDNAIRHWAQNDPILKQRLDDADARRIAAVQNMFARFNYDAVDSEIRTMTILYTQVGYIAMEIEEDPIQRLDRVADYVQLFTGVSPSRSEIDRFISRNRR
jgi:hypothetical protein